MRFNARNVFEPADDELELKIIDVSVCKLRKKLANASEDRNFIETVWGRGYVLREPHEDEVRIPA